MSPDFPNGVYPTRLAIAVKAAAQRVRVPSNLMIEYADDPFQLLAAIIAKCEEEHQMRRDVERAAEVCENQLRRIRERGFDVAKAQHLRVK